MFQGCSSMNSFIKFTSTSKVTNMNSMFDGCEVFNKSINFDTSSVSDMSYMFHKCYAFNDTLNLSLHSIVSGTDQLVSKGLYNMFYKCGLDKDNYTNILDHFTSQFLDYLPTYVDLGIVSNGTVYTPRNDDSSYDILTTTYHWYIEDGGSGGIPIPEDDKLKFVVHITTETLVNIKLTGTYTIDWGDGEINQLTSHIYTSAGDYIVQIDGQCSKFNGGSISDYIINVLSWGDLGITDFSYSMVNAQLDVISNEFPEDVVNTSHMFEGARVPYIDWTTTSSVLDMSYMFNGATLQTIKLNTDHVIDMSGMFRMANMMDTSSKNILYSSIIAPGVKPLLYSQLTTTIAKMLLLQLNSLSDTYTIEFTSTKNVEDMSYMFENSTTFNQLLDWDTSNVMSMMNMFTGATNYNQSLGGWNIMNVSAMDDIFNGIGMTEATYEATLIGWASQVVQKNVYVGDVKDPTGRYLYHAGAIPAYLYLIGQGWIIIDGGSGQTHIKCFLKGTNVLTPSGYRRIELLKIGDKVLTHDNRPVRIVKINKSNPSPSKYSHPYKIPKGTRVDNFVCNEDLFLTPEHAIMVKYPYMVPIQSTIFKQVTDQPLEYFHLVLPNYYTDTIIANGIPCESLCLLAEQKIAHRVIVQSNCRRILSQKEYMSMISPSNLLM